jgi:hypothetical protein
MEAIGSRRSNLDFPAKKSVVAPGDNPFCVSDVPRPQVQKIFQKKPGRNTDIVTFIGSNPVPSWA